MGFEGRGGIRVRVRVEVQVEVEVEGGVQTRITSESSVKVRELRYDHRMI